jgi:MFS family permease
VGFQFFSPFLPLYVRELGVTEPGGIALWSGLLSAVTPAVSGFLSPLFGRLADRLGRKMMLIRSLAGFVVIIAAMGLVTSVEQLLAARLLQGLFAGFTPMAMALASVAAPRDKVPTAIGMVQSAQLMSVAVGPVAGGYVASHFGIRYAFFVTAAMCALALVGLIVLFKEIGPGAGRSGVDGTSAPRVPLAQCCSCARWSASAWEGRSPWPMRWEQPSCPARTAARHSGGSLWASRSGRRPARS